MATSTSNPAAVLSATDHGDDMQLRLRYQAAYAGFVAIGMLLDDARIEEVYCEHHEDVLVRMCSGKFCGCQVKTRAARLGPFKSDDSAIHEAISRFVELEVLFPEHFERFIIATNVDFFAQEGNSKSLPFVLDLAKVIATKPKLSNPIRRYISSIAAERKCKRDLVWRVFAKVELESQLPQFRDIEYQLASQIAEVLSQTYRRFDELNRASKAVIQLMTDASSLNWHTSLSRYFVFSEEPAAAEQAAIIAGKRITRDRLSAAIVRCFDDASLLESGNRISVAELPRGFNRLEKKMSAGGVRARDVMHIKDLKYSMDRLLQEWMYKYGPEEATKRYDHLQILVREDCYDAEGQTRCSTDLYGASMLARLRANLRNTMQSQFERLQKFGIATPHLLGVAGILTEECKVWWSDEFDVDSEIRDEADAS